MIRTVITGAGGRMGATLVRLVKASSQLVLVGATERRGSPGVGQDAGAAAQVGQTGVALRDDLGAVLADGQADVVIDFTSPEASLEHARACAERKVPLVIGSTGFSAAAKAELATFARAIPMVVAPNMSVGVNVMFKVAQQLARTLGEGFDVEIVEAHHRMKKDAPSGTALRLAEEVAAGLGRSEKDFAFARHGQIGARKPNEIGVQTLRGGDVVGEHTVFFFGDGERLELTHRATSRDQFAQGALRAAGWLPGRPPGLYDMQDVLGLRVGA